MRVSVRTRRVAVDCPGWMTTCMAPSLPGRTYDPRCVTVRLTVSASSARREDRTVNSMVSPSSTASPSSTPIVGMLDSSSISEIVAEPEPLAPPPRPVAVMAPRLTRSCSSIASVSSSAVRVSVATVFAPAPPVNVRVFVPDAKAIPVAAVSARL